MENARAGEPHSRYLQFLIIITSIGILTSVIVLFLQLSFQNAFYGLLQVLLFIFCTLLALRMFFTSRDNNIRFVALVITFAFLAWTLTNAFWGIAPSVHQEGALYFISRIGWLLAYGIMAYGMYALRNSKQWLIQPFMNSVVTALGLILVISVIIVTIVYLKPEDVFTMDVFFALGAVTLNLVVLTMGIKILLMNAARDLKYIVFAIVLFFIINSFSDTLYLLSILIHVDLGFIDSIMYDIELIFMISSLVIFTSDFIKNKTVEEVTRKLQDTNVLLDDLLRNSPDAMCICDAGGNAVLINDQFLRIFDMSRGEVLGKYNIFKHSMIRTDIAPESFDRVRHGEKVIIPLARLASAKITDKDRYISVKMFPNYSSDKSVSGYVAIIEDITEHKMADEKIKMSLEEKEVLLKELHHRVKNNLQIVSSLLNIQSEKIKDEQALETFKESQNRVRSMALVHERLYRSKDLTYVHFNEYIPQLSRYLFSSYGVEPGRIDLKLDVDNVSMNIDRAIPCGLIINELISNSIKHAFPEKRKGTITIGIRNMENKYILVVSDDGVGIPPEVDYLNSGSLGLKLVYGLAEQLNGQISHSDGPGTTFYISFPG